MRFRLMMPVMLCLPLLCTVGLAQTVAEQLQKAIYLQETTGDLDGAIQIYRRILASTPPRELAAQVQYRLAQASLQKGDLQSAALEFQMLAQSYPEYKGLIASMASPLRPAAQQELGTVENGRYRNFLTNVELTIPDGWSFKGDGPSSGNGQMAFVESGSGITIQVWMKPLAVKAADLAAALQWIMQNKASMRPQGWKIRPESVQNRSLSGHAGLSATADYTVNGAPMVEYDFWVLSGRTHVFFFGRAEQEQLETLQADIETVAKSTVIP